MGVSFIKREQKYIAQAKVDGKTTFLGYHDTKEEARRALEVTSPDCPLSLQKQREIVNCQLDESISNQIALLGKLNAINKEIESERSRMLLMFSDFADDNLSDSDACELLELVSGSKLEDFVLEELKGRLYESTGCNE